MQQFVVPPGWPAPPPGWAPPPAWQPDPAWPPAPAGWVFWREVDDLVPTAPQPVAAQPFTPAASSPSASYAGAPNPPYLAAPYTRAPNSGAPYAGTPYAGGSHYPGAPTAWGLPSRPVVDNRFAWILALIPLSFIVLDLALLAVPPLIADPLGMFIPLGLYIWLCVADSRRLARVGVEVSPVWVLILPVYLILRTVRGRQTWWIPGVWLTTMIAYSVATLVPAILALDDDVALDPTEIERELSVRYAEDYDLTVLPECPDEASAPVGGTIECEVTYWNGGGTYTVVITVISPEGEWTWEELAR